MPTELETPRLKIKTAEDFSSRKAFVVYRLLTEDLISARQPTAEGRNYDVDFSKATEVLKELSHQKHQGIDYPDKEFAEQTRTALKQSIKAFVDNDFLSRLLVLQVGALLRPSNIELTDEPYARFIHLNDTFPADPGGRATLQISKEYVSIAMREIEWVLGKDKSGLSKEAIIRMTLRNGVSHEYGHAVTRALILTQANLIAPRQPNQALWETVRETEIPFYNAIFTSIAPNSELATILGDEPQDGTYTTRWLTSSERIAVGFEYLGLRFALQETGLEPEKIEAVMKGCAQLDREKIKDWIEISHLAKSKRVTLEDVCLTMADIQDNLRGTEQSVLADPPKFTFGATNLGYLYPLDRPQLEQLIDEAASGRIWKQENV